MITYGQGGVLNAGKIHYDASGNPTASDEASFLSDLAASKATTLFVISHGWNNDEGEADALYDAFFTAIGNVLPHFPAIDRSKCFVLAIIWPSKKFDENQFAQISSSIPGVPAGATGGAASLTDDTIDAALVDQLDALKNIANDPASSAFLDHAIAQIPLLGVSQSAQNDFVQALAQAFPAPPQESDPGLDDGLSQLNTVPGYQILATIAQTLGVVEDRITGSGSGDPVSGGSTGGSGSGGSGSLGGSAGAMGSAQELSGGAQGFNPLQAVKNAALALANVTTYWTMKERAGIVGKSGVAQTLAKAMGANPGLNVNLIGHSFGGRVVTAAANALTGGSAGHRVETISLLQAAYSHYGMAHNYQPNTDGSFRSVLTGGKVVKGIAITHSTHDVAVGLAYPIASALAHQIGQGTWINPFGGMGSDGAQTTPEAFNDTLGPVGTAYSTPAMPFVRNLNGDSIIMSHGDVTHDEIAYAVLRGL